MNKDDIDFPALSAHVQDGRRGKVSMIAKPGNPTHTANPTASKREAVGENGWLVAELLRAIIMSTRAFQASADMLRHGISRGRVASQQLMKVNKEALSEILSLKASWRLAGCLPAS
ncbi:hypothetical protein INR49_027427 [Caranx melampygus]|nr:hypothetical protein INR49_027427 [Caranx melampygus]